MVAGSPLKLKTSGTKARRGSHRPKGRQLPGCGVRAASSSHGFALNLPAGEYDVFVSVGRRDGTPVIALPLADTDGHRRYKLGKITVAPKAQP